MKDSTLRTLLRRLEAKGFLEHTVDGRTYIYRAIERRSGAATRAVRHIIDRFLGGSAEDLVLGLVDHDVLTPQQLDRLAKTVAARKRSKS
jgi:predicted transcriptional regulator